MNDVYMSDEEVETSIDQSTNPANLPSSGFVQKSPASVAHSPAKSAPTKDIGNLSPLAPDNSRGFLPSFEKPPPTSGAANSTASYPLFKLLPDNTAFGPGGFPPNFQEPPPAATAFGPAKSTASYPPHSMPSRLPDNSAFNPGGFPPNFQEPPSAASAFDPAKSAASYPTHSMASFVPNSSMAGPGRFPAPYQKPPPAAMAQSTASYPAPVPGNPSGCLPDARQLPPGMAFGPRVPIPLLGAEQTQAVLQEDPQLTQQVTALICQKYPVYAADPLLLQFAVCNELKLLKKLREERSQPVAQPPPSSDSYHVSPTPVEAPDAEGDCESCTANKSSTTLSSSSSTEAVSNIA